MTPKTTSKAWGPIILETGVAFRVWAPYADRVSIVGDFNGEIWKRRFSSDPTAYSDDFGGNASGNIEAIEEPYDLQSHRGRIELPPYAVLIYSQEPS